MLQEALVKKGERRRQKLICRHNINDRLLSNRGRAHRSSSPETGCGPSEETDDSRRYGV